MKEKERKRRRRRRKWERAREEPRINLASELTRKGTCPIEVRPSAVFAGPYGSHRASGVALRCRCCCRCCGHAESAGRQVSSHPKTAALAGRGPRGPLAAGCPPLKTHSPSASTFLARVSDKSDLPQSTAWHEVG